jgi:ABC-2 type transport system ATP-binding protein
MKQKIAIARALVHEPEFLFLDEPTSGLDPVAALTVRNFLLELKKEGRTIFINTHNLDDAERLCDTIGVMKTRLLATGSPEELSREFWGRTTVMHLRAVTPAMIEAVRTVSGVTGVKQVDNKLLIDVVDPVTANPGIVQAVVRSGGEIEFVNELKRTLEDVYIKLLGGQQ